MANIVLTMPHGGPSIHTGAAQGFFLWPSRKHRCLRLDCSTSAGVHSFNTVWAAALNQRERGFTHFAMIHADIEPTPYWLDVLIDEMERLGADVVSTVVPLKGDEGLTSTAIDTGNLWKPKRLTMAEVFELPETFNFNDVGGPLLLNNGLWVCDMTKPWVESFQFEMLNRVVKRLDGNYHAEMASEDWMASRRWNELGLSIYATRKVAVNHYGDKSFTNREPWGQWKTDYAHTPCEAVCE